MEKFETIQEPRPYVLWRRVSTKEQGKSELGLEAQSTIARMFMGKEPERTFTDVFSGTKLKQCKALWEAIDYCKLYGCVLVIAKSDRCRNVQEALEILDNVGSRNLIFCDLQSSDRFVLTVMWAMWERQAIMGRINTKLALAERKKQIHKQGGFVSKSGRWCNHLGRQKGEWTTQAISGMSLRRSEISAEWKAKSGLYGWVKEQLAKRRSQKDILDEAQRLYRITPEVYGTRTGKPLNAATLCRWAKEIHGAVC